MTQKLKHLLPIYKELDFANMTKDQLDQWKNIIQKHDVDFNTALAANSQLCRFHPNLTTSTYGELLQINFTDSVHVNTTLEIDNFDDMNSLGSYKEKMNLARTQDSAFSEHSFTKPTEIYKQYEDLVQQTLSKFQSKPTRIRLVKLQSGKSITPHIDYDPSYAIRIIIPIVSPKDCLNIFWHKNKIETVCLTEGVAYFLNTGFRHAVVNLSNESRYTLMISLNGTQDVECIIKG